MDMQTKNHSLTVICNQLVWNLALTFSFESLCVCFFPPLEVSSPCWIKSQKKRVSFHPSNKGRKGVQEGIFWSIFHMDVSGFSSLWTHLNTVYHLQAANAISDRLSRLVTASQTLSLVRLISLRLHIKCLCRNPARVGVCRRSTVQRRNLINIFEPKQKGMRHTETLGLAGWTPMFLPS